MEPDYPDDEDTPSTEELKDEAKEAIDTADAVVCVALEVGDDEIESTNIRALEDAEELDDNEQMSLMMSMNEALQDNMFGPRPPMGGGMQPIAVDADTLEEMGLKEQLDEMMEEMDDEDSDPEGMFQ